MSDQELEYWYQLVEHWVDPVLVLMLEDELASGLDQE